MHPSVFPPVFASVARPVRFHAQPRCVGEHATMAWSLGGGAMQKAFDQVQPQHRGGRGHSNRPRPSLFREQTGFTAIELLVVVALLGVLAAIAAPNFLPLIERWRVRQAAEELQHTIQFTRFEAMRLASEGSPDSRVTLRRSAPSGDCQTSAGQWDCGWFIFHDLDGDGTQDSGEPTLRLSPTPKGLQVELASGADSVSFDAFGDAGASLGFIFKPTRAGSTVSSALCISPGGFSSLRKDATSC